MGEPPCTTTDSKTTRQQIEKSCALPGTPAKTGRSTSKRELKPRGPNQAIIRRSARSTPDQASDSRKTGGRTSNTMRANSKVGPVITVNPLQMSELPNSTKVKSNAISAVAPP